MDKATSDGDDPVEHSREIVIEAMMRTAELYGLKQSYGRLYGILFFADELVSLDELVDESGYAKSTVSAAMKKMDRFHLVHRQSVPGEGKKVFYEAEKDIWYVGQKLLERQGRREVDLMMRALDSAEKHLEEADDERAESDLEKIRSIQTTYKQLQRGINFLTSSSVERIMELLNRMRRSNTN